MPFESANTFDVMIIGAGAAGLMAAITARECGGSVLLLDGKRRVGAKILMSGGTRCNVTNRDVSEKDFSSEQIRMVRHVLKVFPAERVKAFFEASGVALALEADGKYFPATHSAQTVLDALLHKVRRAGVEMITGRNVTALSFRDNLFFAQGDDFLAKARTALVATGGLSHPNTGSDGAGYGFAKQFGHRIVFTTPALTPFTVADGALKKLAGLSVPGRVTLRVNGKKQASFEGACLFTHVGLSGPAMLNMSRHWLRAEPADSRELRLNALPGMDADAFRKRLLEAAARNPERTIKACVSEHLPERFAETLLRKVDLDPGARLHRLRAEERERLIRTLFDFPLDVRGVVGYGKAEATAGGVDLAEVDHRTLESKKRPGLFFAGEVLDVDGRIGGFNFQWAWSSGYAAGQGAACCARAGR